MAAAATGYGSPRGRWRRVGSTLALLVAIAAPAAAAPILSVDLHPGKPGVQGARSVTLGSTLIVDLVVSAVDDAAPLQAFALDLAFDASVLEPVSAEVGAFLPAPSFTARSDLGAASVGLTVASLGATGAAGAGVIARITFTSTSLGFGFLELRNVTLSAPFGEAILGVGVSDGTLEVVPVPEPGSFALVGSAMAALALAGRRRRAALR